MLRRGFIAVCGVLMLAFSNGYAQAPPDGYRYENIAGFAHWLVEHKEFYRAYQEYHRLHTYYPALYPYERFLAASLYCAYESRQHRLIMERLAQSQVQPPWSWIFLFDSAFNTHAAALKSIVAQRPDCVPNDDICRMVKKREMAFSFFTGGVYDELSPDNALYAHYDLDRIKAYSMFRRSQYKNEYAALGWGLLPGAGYIYGNNTENGIIAAIVIGVCTALTYFAVDSNNNAIAFFTGSIGAFFYGGSIIGGSLAAKRTNRAITRDVQKYLEEEFEFAKDRETIFINYGKPKTH